MYERAIVIHISWQTVRSLEGPGDDCPDVQTRQAEAYGFLVLSVVRACLAEGNQEEKALALLEKHLGSEIWSFFQHEQFPDRWPVTINKHE